MSGKPSTPKQQNNKPAAAGTPKGQQNPKKEQPQTPSKGEQKPKGQQTPKKDQPQTPKEQPQTPKNDQKNNKPTENKGQEKKQQQNNKPAENKGQEKKQAIVAAAKPAEKNQNQQPKKVKPTPAAEKKDEISLSPDFSDLPDTSFFAVEVDPKKALSQSLFFPVKLAQVIISPTAKDGDRSTLFAIVDDKKWPLATLTAGKVDQLPLRLTFDEGINLTFIVSGSASIFVYGNYGTSDDQDDMYDSEDDDEMAARFGGYDDSDDEDEDSDSDQGDGVSSDEEPIKPGQLKRKGTPATALIAASSSKKAKKDVEVKAITDVASKPTPPAPKATPKATPKAAAKAPAPTAAPAAGPGQPVTLKNGLKYRDLQVGNGKVPTLGKKVTVSYVGRLANGKQFDKSNTFSFRLGVGEVIKGWDVGVATMKVGGKRQLTVPPELGYGKAGTPDGTIPRNATLIFDVELKGVQQ